jgi:thiol-disulfide isomerase/thioredoxin
MNFRNWNFILLTKKELNASFSNVIALTKKFTLVNPKNESNTLLQIFEKNKKDLYLVDFWATWCIPCKNESIKLEQLRASLPNNVGILRISLDKLEDKMNWRKEAKNDLNNFITTLNFEEPICKVLNINEIPRFVLFKRNGELIDDNFLMPSEPKILKKIFEFSIK